MVTHTIKRGNSKLTLSINQELLKKYKKFCEKEGFSVSGQIERFMKSQLSNKTVWESIFGK